MMNESELMMADDALQEVQERILVVDDEDVTRMYLEGALADSGFAVQSAACFEEVRQALARQRFDVVLMDLVFADESYGGFEIVEHVHALCPDTAIIIITSYPDTDSAVQAVRISASDYLTKPVRVPDLISAVKRSLRKKRALMPARGQPKRLTAPKLSPRESQVLSMLFKGYSYTEIAEALDCEASTARTHGKRIYKKLGATSRSEAIHEAIHHNLIQ